MRMDTGKLRHQRQSSQYNYTHNIMYTKVMHEPSKKNSLHAYT